MQQDLLTSYLAKLLKSDAIKDYCPNGLQIYGKNEIKTIISGVSANLQFIEQAIDSNADAILVHHGFFWRGEDPCIKGVKKNRLQLLLKNNINCFAYHLPLDIHPVYGNNILLAKCLGVSLDRWLQVDSGLPLIGMGHIENPLSAADFSTLIEQKLQRKPLYLPAMNNKNIQKVAWCTGAGQDFIEQAAASGADAFITGEVSERTTALCYELNIHCFASGHHATERFGVKALGEHIATEFSIAHQFIDIENPV